MIISYLNCFSGISGDMFLGSLVDAGVDGAALQQELAKLGIAGYELSIRPVTRCGIAATKVDVILDRESKAEARTWKDIVEIAQFASLTPQMKERGLHIFRGLFEAEAKVHGKPFDAIHLHELGAVDCLVDIFGTVIGLSLLGIERLCVSPVNVGSGTVKTSHGVLPVPAPATVELLKGYPVYSSGVSCELTTPTGAALLKGLGAVPSPCPEMTIVQTGYGAGNKDFSDSPNVLRLITGESVIRQPGPGSGESVTVIETNIDDMNPQFYGPVMEMLFSAGALDVSLDQIIMKKGRPGTRMTVLCREADRSALIDLLFRETTTLGVRFSSWQRSTLDREIRTVTTEFGDVRVKIAKRGDVVVSATAEFDDLVAISKNTGNPLKKISEIVNAQINNKV